MKKLSSIQYRKRIIDILRSFTIVSDEWEPLIESASIPECNRECNITMLCGYQAFLHRMARVCFFNDTNIYNSLRTHVENITSVIPNSIYTPQSIHAITEGELQKLLRTELTGVVRHVVISSSAGELEIAIVIASEDLLTGYNVRSNKNHYKSIIASPDIVCHIKGTDQVYIFDRHYNTHVETKDVEFSDVLSPRNLHTVYNYYGYGSPFVVNETNSVEATTLAGYDEAVARALAYGLGSKGILTSNHGGTTFMRQYKETPLAKNELFHKDFKVIHQDILKELRSMMQKIIQGFDTLCKEEK